MHGSLSILGSHINPKEMNKNNTPATGVVGWFASNHTLHQRSRIRAPEIENFLVVCFTSLVGLPQVNHD